MKAERMEIMQGDIVRMEVDAVVNAANRSLLGGGGVDGAIHRAAGPRLLEECRTLEGCETGEAKLTRGYDLPARYVIHTVGPIWQGGDRDEEELLARCYRNSMDLAAREGIRTLAFPSISTGAYRFPLERACRIALREVRDSLRDHPEIEKVFFVCFGEDDRKEYEKVFREMDDEKS